MSMWGELVHDIPCQKLKKINTKMSKRNNDSDFSFIFFFDSGFLQIRSNSTNAIQKNNVGIFCLLFFPVINRGLNEGFTSEMPPVPPPIGHF